MSAPVSSAAPLIIGPSAPLGMPTNMASPASAAKHNAKKGFNAATKLTAKNQSLMHFMFIRHAESSNNVLAEQITKEYGINPYGPNSGKEVMEAYDRRRVCDPDLSPLGQKQAALLPQHPHLLDVQFTRLAMEGRVRMVTSPMQRTILTSQPLLRSVPEANLKATLVADVCEKGGSYTCVRNEAGVATNKVSPGLGRADLQRLWGSTHDASGVREDGWWHTECPGAEDDAAFDARLTRADLWLQERIEEYRADPVATPDYLIIVSHADFIDAIITRILRLDEHAKNTKYIFYSSNTAIHHLEFEVNQSSSAGAAASNPAADLSKRVVRVRGTNIKPVNVHSHELAEVGRLHHTTYTHDEQPKQ